MTTLESTFKSGIPKKSPPLNKKSKAGLKIEPFFVAPGEDPYKQVEWIARESKVKGAEGEEIFAMKDLETPKHWSQLAVDIAASKYLRRSGVPGTCPESGEIAASNPCSEYMFLNDSACNLSSINLTKFLAPEGSFDVAAFKHCVHMLILAQEILVDFSSYPTAPIATNSHDYRPLGLGYANLGTFLMIKGLPYDSDAGRAWASGITALMTAEAYRSSAQIAREKGPFKGYKKNSSAMSKVILKHLDSARATDSKYLDPRLFMAVETAWVEAAELGQQFGFRNSQVSVLAPTGTIGFLMDCDTTGVEPDFALVKFKGPIWVG